MKYLTPCKALSVRYSERPCSKISFRDFKTLTTFPWGPAMMEEAWGMLNVWAPLRLKYPSQDTCSLIHILDIRLRECWSLIYTMHILFPLESRLWNSKYEWRWVLIKITLIPTLGFAFSFIEYSSGMFHRKMCAYYLLNRNSTLRSRRCLQF